MEYVQLIDKRCAEALPYYTDLTRFTSHKYKQGLTCVQHLYSSSSNKVKTISKVSRKFRSDVLVILSQTTQDLLELLEAKFSIQSLSTKVKGKTDRLLQIYNHLRDEKLLPYLQKIWEMNQHLINRGKKIHQDNIYPLFMRVRATVEVSRQILLEVLLARLTQIKMTYQCSKDSITMFWSGEFKEEKIVQQIKQKFGCLKQFTVSFVQKGMEIKISKEDLVENYHHIMEKLSELMKDAGEKGVSQWTETKTKTVDLYQTVLRRIKEKERRLTITYAEGAENSAGPSLVEEPERKQEQKVESGEEESKTGSESQE